VARRREQEERAVPHHVQRLREGAHGRIARRLERDLMPPQAGDLDVLAEEAAWLGGELRQLSPFGLRDQEVRAAQLAEPTHVVLVQMRQDGRADVARRVAQRRELRGERLLLADLEPRKPVVEEARNASREVGVVGDRRPILSRVEQDEAAGVLDHVGVDRTRLGPASRGQQPPVERLPRSIRMLRMDLDGAGAKDRDRLDRIGHSGLRRRACRCGGGHLFALLPSAWPGCSLAFS